MLTHGFVGPNYRNNSDKQKKYNLPELLGRIQDSVVFIDTEYAIRPDNCFKFPECPHIIFSADETENFFVYKSFENSEVEEKHYYRFGHVYDDKLFIIVDETSNLYQMWPLVYHNKWSGTPLELKKDFFPEQNEKNEITKRLLEQNGISYEKPADRYSRQSYERYSSQGGVYILMDGEEIVYVGMSESNMSKRIKIHKKTKKFNKVLCLSVENNYCHSGIESVLIKYFNPKYNKAVVGTGWTKKTKAFCRALSKQIDVRTVDHFSEIQYGFRLEDYPISLEILPSIRDVSHEFYWLSSSIDVKRYASEHSEYRSKTTIDGLQKAKENGKKLGRKPKIDDEAKSNIIKEKLVGSSLAQIAKKYSISRSLVQHIMREYKSAS